MSYSGLPTTIPSVRLSSPAPQADNRSFGQASLPNSPFQAHPQHSESYYRIQQRLINQTVATDAVIYLLQCENDVFHAYNTLLTRGERIFVSVRGRALNLTLAPDICHDLNTCSANEERWQLTCRLPSLVGAHHWLLQRPLDGNLSPLQASFVDTSLSRTSSGSSCHKPCKRKKSNASSPSARSRRQSTTTINSETGELASILESAMRKTVALYTCPLVAQNHCREGPFKKLGNCKNHVERVHRWYTDAHADWSNEIPISQVRQERELGTNPQPSPRPHTPNDVHLAYVGLGSRADPMAAISSACAAFDDESPVNHQGQSLTPLGFPQMSSSLSRAEAMPYQPESDNLTFDDVFSTDAAVTPQQPHNHLQAPPQSRGYRGTPQLMTNLRIRGPSPTPPWPPLE